MFIGLFCIVIGFACYRSAYIVCVLGCMRIRLCVVPFKAERHVNSGVTIGKCLHYLFLVNEKNPTHGSWHKIFLYM